MHAASPSLMSGDCHAFGCPPCAQPSACVRMCEDKQFRKKSGGSQAFAWVGDVTRCSLRRLLHLLTSSAMLCAPTAALHVAPIARPAPRTRNLRCASRKKTDPAWPETATTAGGGYKGVCDIDTVKQVIQECSTLDGERQKACWASSGACRVCAALSRRALSGPQHSVTRARFALCVGCDIEVVTDHYAKAAGLKNDKK